MALQVVKIVSFLRVVLVVFFFTGENVVYQFFIFLLDVL